jgi:hypothetical protein
MAQRSVKTSAFRVPCDGCRDTHKRLVSQGVLEYSNIHKQRADRPVKTGAAPVYRDPYATRGPRKESEDEFTEPEEEDYVMGDARGGGVTVGQQGGRHLGTFPDQDAAEEFIRALGAKDGFWPNVWFISDHGNPILQTGIWK